MARFTASQGEGGEQGDPMMPLLCSLGQHGALEAAHSQFTRGEPLPRRHFHRHPQCSSCRTCVWIRSRRIEDHCGFTWAKRRSGTEPATVQSSVTLLRGWCSKWIQELEFGEGHRSLPTNKASKCSEPLLDTLILCPTNCRPCWRSNTFS